MATRLIDDNIITADAPPHLIGGKHRETGRITFPLPSGPDGALYDPMPLSTDGTLWSWTVQRFRPKSPPYAGPEAFEPYAVGYVALADQLIVEARLDGIPFDRLRVDMPVTMALVPFATDPDGTTVLTYAFRAHEETAA
jgi:uncharacterized OB-fold protein